MGLYLLTLWTIVSCIPSFYAIPFLPHLQVGVVAGYSGYFLLGAYLAHLGRPSRCAMLISLAIFLTASAFTAALTILWTVADGHPNETAFTYFFPTVAIGTVALFRVFSFYQPGPIAGRVFSRLAALCFPVYFMHLVMLDILRGGMLGVAITPYFTQPIVALFVWSALTFTICAAISAVVRLLPGAARVVG
jgi:surface polysaccharide O-acyltransferase-like enzyme